MARVDFDTAFASVCEEGAIPPHLTLLASKAAAGPEYGPLSFLRPLAGWVAAFKHFFPYFFALMYAPYPLPGQPSISLGLSFWRHLALEFIAELRAYPFPTPRGLLAWLAAAPHGSLSRYVLSDWPSQRAAGFPGAVSPSDEPATILPAFLFAEAKGAPLGYQAPNP